MQAKYFRKLISLYWCLRAPCFTGLFTKAFLLLLFIIVDKHVYFILKII